MKNEEHVTITLNPATEPDYDAKNTDIIFLQDFPCSCTFNAWQRMHFNACHPSPGAAIPFPAKTDRPGAPSGRRTFFAAYTRWPDCR